tara:strand:+ start:4849 stop:5532 length:684 start_codon:yes stop_codon:yes gene_type:complete
MSSHTNKYIAIGDIHGCSKTLELLLERLHKEYGTTRTYVFMGDYVDRGPDTKGVVELLLNFRKTHECVFIRGNHDAMFMKYLTDPDYLLWFDNGGASTMESYNNPDGSQGKIPYSHLKFFLNTVPYYDSEHFFFVHGGPPITQSIKESLGNEVLYSSFMWSRDHIDADENDIKWEKTVVFGHTPVRSPIDTEKQLGIDTGCVYEQFGKLTAVALPERDFIQQKRIDF